MPQLGSYRLQINSRVLKVLRANRSLFFLLIIIIDVFLNMAEEKIPIIEENSADFKRNVLPTNIEIIKAIYFKHLKKKETFKVASDAAAWCVMAIWTRLDIPIWGHRAVENRVRKLFGDFQKILGSDKSRPNFHSQVEQFNVRFLCFVYVKAYVTFTSKA